MDIASLLGSEAASLLEHRAVYPKDQLSLPSPTFVDDLVVNRYNLLGNGTFEADMGGWSEWQAGLSRLSISHDGDWSARVRYACPTGTGCTDYAIDNSGTLDQVETQVDRIWKELLHAARKS